MVVEQTSTAIALLAQNEGNVAKTSRALGITAPRLRKLRDENLQLYEEARRRIAEGIFDKVLLTTDLYLEEILRRIEDPDELRGMKVKDMMVVVGIGVDKTNVLMAIKSKLGDVQKDADSYSDMNLEELQNAIDGEYRELTDESPAKEPVDEGVPDTSEDGIPSRPRGVSAFRVTVPGRSHKES